MKEISDEARVIIEACVEQAAKLDREQFDRIMMYMDRLNSRMSDYERESHEWKSITRGFRSLVRRIVR